MASGVHSFAQSTLDTVKRNKVIKLLREDRYAQAFTLLSDLQDHYNFIEPGRDYAQLLLNISYIFDEKGNYRNFLSLQATEEQALSKRVDVLMSEWTRLGEELT